MKFTLYIRYTGNALCGKKILYKSFYENYYLQRNAYIVDLYFKRNIRKQRQKVI